MQFNERKQDTAGVWKQFALAGFCGGAAEIAWIALIATLMNVSVSEVARQVTASVVPGWADLLFAPALGLVIHLLLSLALGIAFGWALWIPFVHRLQPAAVALTAVAVLVGVWAFNFFVLLPLLNPAFVALLPYAGTLFSKALFGVVMGWALVRGSPRVRKNDRLPNLSTV